RSEMDLVGLHHLAHEPAERTVAIERASLRDGVHEAALDAEAGIEQEVEVGAGVSERPRSGGRRWPADRVRDVVQEADDLAHVVTATTFDAQCAPWLQHLAALFENRRLI